MKYYLDKKLFYEKLKSFTNKHTGIFFFHDFGHYTLVFDWRNLKANGEFNPIMFAQIIDRLKSGSKRYVTKDLVWNCLELNTTTDYKLYKFLRDWIQKSIEKYEMIEKGELGG